MITPEALPWNAVRHRYLTEHGFTFADAELWLRSEEALGRKRRFEDFLRHHGICRSCRGLGVEVVEIDASDTLLWNTCLGCSGSGTAQARPISPSGEMDPLEADDIWSGLD